MTVQAGDAVRIDFQVGGLAEVQRALQGVGKALGELEKRAVGGARLQEQAQRKTAQAHERAGRDAVRIAEKIARDEQRTLEKAEREKTRTVEKAERDRARLRENAIKAHSKYVVQQAEAETRARDRMNQALGRGIGRGVGGVLGGGAKIAGVVMGVGGGFGIASALGTEIQNRAKASEIAIQSNGAMTGEQVYGKASSAGTAHGKETSEVLGGLDQFLAKSGDASMATKTLDDLLKLSNATGASFEDLSRVAGQIFASDKTQSAAELVQLMRDLGAQGRAASVDMKELAQYAARLSGGGAEFGGRLSENARALGGLAQLSVAKGGATNSAEATESVLSLGLDINEHSDRFKALGITPTGKDGKLRSVTDLIRESVSATNGDKGQLMELYGRRSYRAVTGYANAFLDAKAGGATKEQALAKADAALAEFAKATLSAGQIDRENSKRMEEADKQLASVLNDLRSVVGAELLPEMKRMIPTLRDSVPAFARLLHSVVELAGFFASHPFAGLGAAIGANIAKEIVAARLGDALQNAIKTQTGASFAAGLGIAAAAITIEQAGEILIDKLAKEDVDKDRGAVASNNSALNLAGELRHDLESGTADPAKLKKAQELANKLRVQLAQQGEDLGSGGSGFATAGGAIDTLLNPKAAQVLAQKQYADQARAFETTAAALRMLEEAAKKTAGAMPGVRQPTGFHRDEPGRSEPLTSPRRGGASR
ncbi:MAG: hypothetical protein U0235_28345 [Polyangiaceae bacterium]